jgi:hypothetical protein
VIQSIVASSANRLAKRVNARTTPTVNARTLTPHGGHARIIIVRSRQVAWQSHLQVWPFRPQQIHVAKVDFVTTIISRDALQ